MVDLLVLITGVVVLWTCLLWGLIDVAHRPAYIFRPAIGWSKGAVVCLIVLSGGFGGAYYLLWLRRELAEAGTQIPEPPRKPKDEGDYKKWKKTRDPWA